MKKTLIKSVAVFTAALLLTLSFFPSARQISAHVNGGYLGDVPKTTETITVDGVKDAIYDQGLSVMVDQEKDAMVLAKGVVRLLYSNGTLYAFAEVWDDYMYAPDKTAQAEAPWRTDSFEVFINIKNSNNVNDVMQYRIDSSGYPSVYNKTGLTAYGPDAAKQYFKYAAVASDNGYCTEFAIPVDAEGKDIGVNFQINDIFEEGVLTWAVVYSEAVKGGTDSWNVGIYPYLSLGKTTVSAPTPEPTENPTEAPDPSTDEPGAETEVPTEEPAEPTEVPAEPTDVPAEPTDVPSEPTDAPAEITDKPADEPEDDKPGNEKESKKLSTPAIIGIAAAAAVIVAAIVILAVKKSKKK